MDKFCKSCGAPLNPGENFFRACGTAMGMVQTLVASPQAGAAAARKSPKKS
jgi:hypothetical protein